MEGFSRIDIFDTKGIEYLFVIGYLVFLIIFWKVASKHERVLQQIKNAVTSISENFLKIPQGIFYNRAHTWTHLGQTGAARVGIDDFLQHLTGEVRFLNLKNPDDEIKKGDLLAEIEKNGKRLKIYSPISGKILDTNKLLGEHPEIINEDPYDEGWIYRIKPTDWRKETSSYLLADEAINWSKREIERFKDFLMNGPLKKSSFEPSMVFLQEGGEIRDNILSDLPDEFWIEFQNEFLEIRN